MGMARVMKRPHACEIPLTFQVDPVYDHYLGFGGVILRLKL